MCDINLIGDYEILKRIGEGAAGVAFKAQHRESGEIVAVKLLHDNVADDMELQRRFVREVSVLERLDHPKIVGHRDCGIHEGQLYLAMEYVDSGTLKDVLRKSGTLPWRTAVAVAVHVCEALAHAHQQGVIHRDLKPANLFLSSDGDVKVGDFGLARDLYQHRLTLEGQTVGTCRFMAPEQVQGKADLSGRLDLYAVGCLLFLMITGRAPFDGATIIEVFEKHLRAEPPSIEPHAEDAPPTLKIVLSMLLAKRPDDRPDNATAAAELLQKVLDGEPLPQTASAPEPPRKPPEPPQPNFGSALLILCGLVAGGLVAWAALGGQ